MPANEMDSRISSLDKDNFNEVLAQNTESNVFHDESSAAETVNVQRKIKIKKIKLPSLDKNKDLNTILKKLWSLTSLIYQPLIISKTIY